MEELLILQEEESLHKAKNLYDAIVAATSYIEFDKKEKPEMVEKEIEKYGKKPKPKLVS